MRILDRKVALGMLIHVIVELRSAKHVALLHQRGQNTHPNIISMIELNNKRS